VEEVDVEDVLNLILIFVPLFPVDDLLSPGVSEVDEGPIPGGEREEKVCLSLSCTISREVGCLIRV
jgi:hypothetical protein